MLVVFSGRIVGKRENRNQFIADTLAGKLEYFQHLSRCLLILQFKNWMGMISSPISVAHVVERRPPAAPQPQTPKMMQQNMLER